MSYRRHISCTVVALVMAIIPTRLLSEQHDSEPDKTIVVRWNAMLLEGIRHAYMGPPMVARALAIAHTCMYDAWAAYDAMAISTQGLELRRPEAERTAANKAMAISYAAYSAAQDLLPDSAAEIERFMRESLGYDPSGPGTHATTAAAVGTASCNAVLAARHKDGANQLGDMGASHRPYADYTGYKAVNGLPSDPKDLSKLEDPDRYQPTYYPDASVRNFYPEFVGAQWFKVAAFAGPYVNEFSRVLSHFPLAHYGSEGYLKQAEELVNISAGLSDEQKMIAEYWMDGPNSELPPGHWCLFAQYVSQRDHHHVDDDVKMFFVVTNALLDSGIAAWTLKRNVDSVRPISAVRHLFSKKQIRAWGGPGRGTVTMDGAGWTPYQPDYLPTPPFPEYPSGHSAFSSAAAHILQLWTGSDDFGDDAQIPAGSSRVEPGIVPSARITLRWPTFSSAANQAGFSRRYGGIHFKSGDLAGRELGCLVAERVWSKAQSYFADSVPRKPTADHWKCVPQT